MTKLQKLTLSLLCIAGVGMQAAADFNPAAVDLEVLQRLSRELSKDYSVFCTDLRSSGLSYVYNIFGLSQFGGEHLEACHENEKFLINLQCKYVDRSGGFASHYKFGEAWLQARMFKRHASSEWRPGQLLPSFYACDPSGVYSGYVPVFETYLGQDSLQRDIVQSVVPRIDAPWLRHKQRQIIISKFIFELLGLGCFYSELQGQPNKNEYLKQKMQNALHFADNNDVNWPIVLKEYHELSLTTDTEKVDNFIQDVLHLGQGYLFEGLTSFSVLFAQVQKSCLTGFDKTSGLLQAFEMDLVKADEDVAALADFPVSLDVEEAEPAGPGVGVGAAAGAAQGIVGRQGRSGEFVLISRAQCEINAPGGTTNLPYADEFTNILPPVSTYPLGMPTSGLSVAGQPELERPVPVDSYRSCPCSCSIQ